MSEAEEKLTTDLEILEAMAAEVGEYLGSDVLFWPMGKGSLPRLTLGGYLMRQHRLNALRSLLDDGQQARLDAAIDKFNQALVERVVRFEQRAHEELRARLRQWGEYLRDLGRESSSAGSYYATSVEPRAMMAALIDKLRMPPYQLDSKITAQLAAYDQNLRRSWISGDFVWPKEWTLAYPKTEYWWLYGRPR